jgi:hypothetical protein
MSLLGLHLDRPRAGTHHADRMHRILGVCHQNGLLWRDVAIRRLDGRTDTQRRTLLEAGEIQAPKNLPFERYGLRLYDVSVLRRVLSLAPQFAYALNVDSVKVEREGDMIWVRVPVAGHSAALSFEDAWALAPDIPAAHLLLGVDGDSQQMLLDLDANTHAGIFGQTHSGKSTLLKTMALSAEMRQLPVALMDPSGGLYPLSGAPSVWQGGMFRSEHDIAACLSYLANATRHNIQTPLYLFVDEGTELTRDPGIMESLATIGRAGRHAGIHLVFGAQTINGLDRDIETNLRARLIGRTSNAQQSAWVSGRRGIGAEYLKCGEFVAITETTPSEGVHLIAAMPSGELLDNWAHRYPPRYGVVPSTPTPDISGPQRITPSAQAATFASEVPAGDPGRRCDDLPPDVARKIAAYYAANHRPPARRMIAGWIQERDIDADKHHRWLGAVLPRRAYR